MRAKRKTLWWGVAFGALAGLAVVPRAHAAGILTQGANAAVAPVATGIAASLAAEQQSDSVALQAQNQLARVSTALQAMQNMQSAARNLAFTMPGTVPDGLQPGGLAPSTTQSWTGANTPTQASAGGQTTVTVNQTAAQALLSWNSFNVGKNTTVDFNQQGNTNWVALNQVTGPAAPSRILGSIKANGQVYVINQNGIIFGGSSQINVGSLIASAAGISVPQFDNNGIYSPETNNVYSPSFTAAGGNITVQPGAQISANAPAGVTNGGGFVLMMGQQVHNQGTISTPSGQTLLAAGDSFLIRKGYSTNGTTANAVSTTAGNEIAVQLNQKGSSLPGGSGAGLVENNGEIMADTGDITLAGETVVQNGVALSTTSTAYRGTIHLLTSASDKFSSVTLGNGSLTRIEPDLDSTSTELDSQRAALIASSVTANGERAAQVDAAPQFDDLSPLADQQDESRIEIVTGGTVSFQNGSDSYAPGGQIAASATSGVEANNGALLDVSGSYDVPLAMSSNDVAVNIQNFETRDDPQNRLTGYLNNSTVYVSTQTLSVVPAGAADSNVRNYTEGGLLEVSGYLANIGHTIGEYTSVGGQIELATGAGGAIVAQTGAVFNLNGGTLQYQSGDLAQSYLIGSNGRLYNVNNAPADITYTGVFNGFSVDHPAWGQNETQTYGDVLSAPSEIFEQGYTQGRAAGTLTLSSPTSIFNGKIDAATVNGPLQINADPAGVSDPYLYTQSEVAEPGTLTIAQLSGATLTFIDTNVDIETGKEKAPGSVRKIPGGLRGTTILAAGVINRADLGGLQVITNGGIDISAPLTFAPGAQVGLYGSSVDIGADITAQGGSITASQVAPTNGQAAELQSVKAGGSASGDITVASNVTLSTAGLWTNLLLDPGLTFTQAFSDGGAVDLASINNLTLDAGSVINTTSGGVESLNGSTKGGAGGNITLQAAIVSTASQTPTGNLTLGGTLRALGVTQGGALTLRAPSFLITAGAAPADASVTTLHPAFFSSGFSAYNLQSTGNITVAPGTVVNVMEPTYQITPRSDARQTGAAHASVFTVGLLPLYSPNGSDTAITQRAGASFSAAIVSNSVIATSNGSVLTIGNGAAIAVDPGQSINLAATGQITIDGSLTAPGGNISTVSSFNTHAALPNGPGTVSVWLGSNAVLNANGQAVSFSNPAGNQVSLAPAGGGITLGSNISTASVILKQGALVEASGSEAEDKQVISRLGAGSDTGLTSVKKVSVQGAGGSITLASQAGIYNNGQLTAKAGGGSAEGGSLSMILEADNVLNAAETAEATPRIISIAQNNPGPQLAAGLAPGSSEGLTIGTAWVSAAEITNGGFGNVSLFARDAFLFNGNVTLNAAQSITLQEGAVTDTTRRGSVTLDAPYVTLNGQTPDSFEVNSSSVPFAVITGFSAQKATGILTVNAATIDIQNELRFGGILPADGATPATDVAGFGTVDLNSSGDLQFKAPTHTTTVTSLTNLVTTANLNLVAREIYATGTPASGTSFGDQAPAALIIAGYNPVAAGSHGSFRSTGVLNISATPGTTPVAPDVLGGALIFDAPTINQGGVIWQPLGSVSFGELGNKLNDGIAGNVDPKTTANFLPGSITSVSAAGMNIPFGGTTDGVNYEVLGQVLSSVPASTAYTLYTVPNGVGTGSITIAAETTGIQKGATLNLQGGGNLTGAGFISGEGGSTDVLSAPLLQFSASGVTQPSLAADPVYAIVAGAQPASAVAYTQSGASGSQPALGRQITIPAGVPGLAAGTYTLLPASYALEPGGYRVEFDGAAALDAASVTALPNGSYAVTGRSALANTNVHGTLPADLTITPGATVLNYADYDQEGYSAFLQANAASLGSVRPILSSDGGTLVLQLPTSSDVSVTDNGSVSFAAATGGIGGMLEITGPQSNAASPDIDIYGDTPTANLPKGTVSLSAAEIDAFNPFVLEIGAAGGGGLQAYVKGITLEIGAVLKAARVVLTANAGGITLNGGSEITTLGQATLPQDSTTLGPLANNGASVLDVGNGYLVYGTTTAADTNYGPITVNDGAQIYTDGAIAFSTSASVSIGADASFGGKYLDLVMPEINVGGPASLNVTAPPGLLITPAVLAALTSGNPAAGIPALQDLNLTATGSLNFYGTTGLDLNGSDVTLEINTPAIYGFGGAADTATIAAGTIVWNGVATTGADGTTLTSALPSGILASGTGTLDLKAKTIILGYSSQDVQQNDVTLNRLAAGFSTVNLNGSSEITANNQGTLSVYRSVPSYGEAGAGGRLNLNTSLLTAQDGATIGFTAGGNINVQPAGETAATRLAGQMAGGEIDLTGQNINITSSVILPSGKLDLQANKNITLGSNSLVSLAGAVTQNVNETVYGFGGTLIMDSARGDIAQNAGSVIDVSAVDNSAGSVSIEAVGAKAGQVALNGTLDGASSGTLAGNTTNGVFGIGAQNFGDFTALNASLNAGGFFQTRDFDLQQGSLTIDNGVQAHNVSVSVDDGTLTVTGLINASGNGGGSINLAASGDLTLASGATLDAHGTAPITDSSDNLIASENTPEISLTTGTGENTDNDTGNSELTIAPGATLKLASADRIARGDLELNVPRLGGATAGDADISVTGPVTITGAATIAVNAFRTYTGIAETGVDTAGNPYAEITQAYLDQINSSDTVPFMTAAASNTDLAARVAGLSSNAAYQFRPGVEIVSAAPNGDLTVEGDIDLVGYRYGPLAGTAQGVGVRGVLEIRAGGNLNVYGSITDGFYTPPSDSGTEFANGWVLYSNEPLGQNQVTPVAVTVAAGSALSDSATVNYPVDITGGTFQANAVAPAALTLSSKLVVPIAFVATSKITDAGQTIYGAGSVVPAGTVLPKGTGIAVGGSFPFAVSVGAVLWPANTPFTVTTDIDSGAGVILATKTVLGAGSLIPGGSALTFAKGDAGLANASGADPSVTTRTASTGSQGQLYGLAQQLPAGNQSWSIGLVSGADLAAADPQTTRAATALASSGNLTLADTHYGIKGETVVPAFSVIRTGTGSLSLVAGGSIDEDSAFGIYTAGTQSANVPVTAELAQGSDGAKGTLLGKNGSSLLGLVSKYAAYYPTGGGNVLVSAQGDLNGYIFTANGANINPAFNSSIAFNDSDAIGNWLWRQGGDGVDSAWWVEYGSLNLGVPAQGQASTPDIVQYTGFEGVGTLGGGNLTVNVGGSASGLDLAVASTGYVALSGTQQQGGGALNVNIGGSLNFIEAGSMTSLAQDEGGVISDMHGNATIDAGSIGTIQPVYGAAVPGDLRFLSPLDSEEANFGSGIDLAPGDGTTTVDARGDLVIDSVDNPGTVQNVTNVTPVDTTAQGNGETDFSLWTNATGVNLFSAGGNVAPVESFTQSSQNSSGENYYPPNLSVIAQNGNIYFGPETAELLPSPDGELELLAADSIIGDPSGKSLVAMSGAALSMVSTPLDPAIQVFDAEGNFLYNNISLQSGGSPIDFGPDTAGGPLHAGDMQPARIYAATGDILDIEFGRYAPATLAAAQTVAAAKPFDIFAGRDIVLSGSMTSPDIFLNLALNDITSITAGRNIIESSFDIAGPGTLVVQAGQNYEAFGNSVIDSIGPIFDINQANRNDGAGVVLLAGAGGNGPDYSGFANTFLNDDTSLGLNDDGSILTGDDAALASWLQVNYGYTGNAAGAYAYFRTLTPGEQDVFLRVLYFDLLNTSGLEFNEPASATNAHAKSYILGQDAIAALFPASNTAGQPITYAGDITMYGNSGVHTDFGGGIQTLTPGGETIIGVEGTTPPASAGVITQGSGDIDIYAQNSVELGESRVLTTFGGNIVIWSALGDINAGRGSKTTIDYTPLQRIYDNYGDVFLSPNVPSSGAGIGALNPIPSVAPGNVNLIAPFGTVDAGEAGIRVSGNLNIAAAHVANAANIQVQGTTSGVPTTAGVNIGALTSAAGAAGAAAQAAEGSSSKPQAAPLPSVWIVEILGYGGPGSAPAPSKHKKPSQAI